ncbi:MAG TPA: tetratricopeptide repeat protein [Myxococcota bacterium]|nr:tetratricopeptide repeat protein [Myxococcota bacterium]HRY94125.1 tetratricopeptide repeat protein [Myxococcota bacterium]
MSRRGCLLAGAALALALLPRPAAAGGPCGAADPCPAPPACPPVPGGPSWVEAQMQQREAEVDRQRDAAIGLLREFLDRHPAAAERADALFRLAELQWERAEARMLQDMKRYEQQLDAFRQGALAERPREPRLELRESLLVYEELLEKHPDFARSDTVLYLYGFALNELGDEQAALGVFRSLLQRYPGSPFAPDAQLAIGEYEFDHAEFEGALKRYAAVLAQPDSPLTDLALYKTAWCHFKRGRAREAAEFFRRVLERARGRKAATQAGERVETASGDLEKETLEDLALTFSEAGGAKEAYRFMQQVGGEDYSIRVLDGLAEVFFRQARFPKAIEAWRLLVERFPLSPKSPDHQARIAQAFEQDGRAEAGLEARRALAETYGPGSAWAQANRQAPAAVARATELAEAALRQVALKRHQQAQAAKEPKAYQVAEQAYRAYLAMFPETPPAPGMHFYLGEVLHQLGRHAEAAGHYGQAAQRAAEPGLRKEAAYAAVLAWDVLRRQAPPPPEPPPKPEALPEAERGFVSAAEVYLALGPEQERIGQLSFEVGRTLYARGHFEPASKRFVALVEARPADRYAEPAADLALDCASRAARWDEVERLARHFLEKGWFAERPLGKQLPELIPAAMFQAATALGAAGEHRRAERAYRRVSDEFPTSELASKALFNAAVSLEKAGEKAAAVAAYQEVVSRYPDKAADALFVIAGVFERQYDYARAASAYTDFARRFPRDERAAGGLLQAALLHRALRESAREAELLEEFTRANPGHEQTPEALLAAARALGDAGDARRAEEVLRRYRKLPPARQARPREAGLQLGLALQRQGKPGLAQKELERCALFPAGKPPAGAELESAAHCRFLLGELVYAEYERIQLRPPLPSLVKGLKQKADLLKKAEGLFVQVVAAGHLEWASAALFRIGDMYARFAQAIYQAPMPAGLSAEEAEVYRQELQSLAFPIEDKALSAFSLSAETARKHDYTSQWTFRTIEMLRKLDPGKWPQEPEARPGTRWADSFLEFPLLQKPLPLPPLPAPAAPAGKGKP